MPSGPTTNHLRHSRLTAPAALSSSLGSTGLDRKVSKSTWCLTSTETTRLVTDGKGGGGGAWKWGKRDMIKLSLNCHHPNDSRIKIGSDESHFNVTLIMTDKVTRQTTTFEEKGESRSRFEPRSLCLPA